MAAGFTVKTGTSATALSAATAKTLVNLIAASTRSALLTEMSVSFDGVTASAVPVLVELCLSTQATAGTAGSSPTPQQIRGKGTALCTAGVDYSAEPTALTPFKHWLVTPNGGLLVVQFPLGRESQFDLSGGTNKAQAIRANAPAVVNTRAYAEFEEE
jgi:hypothetical protein